MIISASRRTDIPAFYAQWIMEKLHAGYCQVAHPWHPAQISRVNLASEAVDAIVFWTKNPAPLLPYLEEIDELGYRYGFLFTVNDYSPAWEPQVPPLRDRLAAFKKLADHLGPDKVVWRYDPIIFSRRMEREFHARAFGNIAAALRGSTRRVIISVLDQYGRIEKRVARAEEQTGDAVDWTPWRRPEFRDLIRELAGLAAENGLAIQTCAEPQDQWRDLPITAGACLDAGWIRKVFGISVPARKDPSQRKDCLCAIARDIGTPDSCPHRCVYCYATGQGSMRELI